MAGAKLVLRYNQDLGTKQNRELVFFNILTLFESVTVVVKQKKVLEEPKNQKIRETCFSLDFFLKKINWCVLMMTT